jgi:hypothetical protein
MWRRTKAVSRLLGLSGGCGVPKVLTAFSVWRAFSEASLGAAATATAAAGSSGMSLPPSRVGDGDRRAALTVPGRGPAAAKTSAC